MRIFKDWKYTVTHDYGKPTYDIEDSTGTCWYWLSAHLEVRPEKWVVGIDANGYINWFTAESVYVTYAPIDGGSVVLCDDFPFEDGHRQRFVEGRWEKLSMECVERSLADVEEDIVKLMAELKALKAGE